MTEYYFDPHNIEIVRQSEPLDKSIVGGLYPLIQLLMQDQFEVRRGDYPSIGMRDWTAEQGVIFGTKIVDALKRDAEGAPLKKKYLERLHLLGLMPDYNYIRLQFGTLTNYAQKVGHETAQPSIKFDNLSSVELLKLIIQHQTSNGSIRPLDHEGLTPAYRQGILPNRKYLYKRLGSLRKINQYLGFIDDSSWDESDFIHFGIEFLDVNGVTNFTRSSYELLSKNSLGPSAMCARKVFGSWGNYVNHTLDAYEKEKNRRIDTEHEINNFFQELSGTENEMTPFELKARSWAEYKLESYLIGPENAIKGRRLDKRSIEDMINRVKTVRGDLTQAEVELAAVELGIFDYIWVMNTQFYITPSLKNLNNKHSSRMYSRYGHR